jgi:hypothetical protein
LPCGVRVADCSRSAAPSAAAAVGGHAGGDASGGGVSAAGLRGGPTVRSISPTHS